MLRQRCNGASIQEPRVAPFSLRASWCVSAPSAQPVQRCCPFPRDARSRMVSRWRKAACASAYADPALGGRGHDTTRAHLLVSLRSYCVRAAAPSTRRNSCASCFPSPSSPLSPSPPGEESLTGLGIACYSPPHVAGVGVGACRCFSTNFPFAFTAKLDVQQRFFCRFQRSFATPVPFHAMLLCAEAETSQWAFQLSGGIPRRWVIPSPVPS